MYQHITPTRFAFADNVTYPLGTPVEMNGGLVLEGEGDIIYELTGTTIPGVSCTLTWEIWVVPPTD